MCGIAGLSSRMKVNFDLALASISHRGPDNSAYQIIDDVVFFHTLLSTRGSMSDIQQPAVVGNQRWMFSYNGEIYNTDYLIKILERPDLKGKSDTLILSCLIAAFGLDFVHYIDGMYGIALYDKVQKKIYLYRDQTGQKNIFYRLDRNGLCFSSEISSLLDITKSQPNNVNYDVVKASSLLGYWPGADTFITGIKRLLPGQTLIFNVQNNCVSFENIPEPKSRVEHGSSGEMLDVVSSTFDANCPVGLNLSGGMDSSIILHKLTELGNKVSTYTTLYAESGSEANSEAILAKKLACHYGSNHNEFEITLSSYISNFEEAYRSLDEPNYNVSIPIYYNLAKFQGLSGRGERVIFSGDGGDEIFCGYPHYNKSVNLDRYLRYLPQNLSSILSKIIFPKKPNLKLSTPLGRWLYFKMWSYSFVQDPSSYQKIYEQLASEFPEFGASSYGNQITSKIMQIDQRFWLGAECFSRVDKIYMGQSVEVRLPFALPSLSARCYRQLNAMGSMSRALGKSELRKQFSGKLPEYINDRSDKVGWRGPMMDWYGPSMRELFLDLIPQVDDGLVRWSNLRDFVSRAEHWPGKQLHWYLSLAIVSKKFNLSY